MSFTDANPKTLVQRIPGKEGNRVYSVEGLSITLTSQAGGFGGKTGLYEIMGLPIKVKTKTGFQTALPGGSIDLAYPNLNSRRGRVGKEIAHTLTTSCNQGYYALGTDMNPDPKVTELARCITARQDSGIDHHKGEKSGVILVTEPVAVLTPAKAEVRQQGRRFKLPNEPMFTITVTDRHGVVYCGYIRKLKRGIFTKLCDVDRAAKFYQLIRYSYASGLDSFASQPHSIWSDFPMIDLAARRLQKVIIENKDFEKLIGQYDRPISFFYCDPPYFATESYYKDVGFTAKDHIRLRDCLLDIKGKFLVSYNDCPEIRELWDKPGIHIEEISRLNNLAQRYDGGCQYAELLISNYDTSERARSVRQLSLFDNETILEV